MVNRGNIYDEIKTELQRARLIHETPMHSPAEAVGVIREEYLEAEQEAFKNLEKFDSFSFRKELIQLAAMCLRACEDLKL